MIFFGAGASATFGIPTTPEFTKETNDILNSKSQSLLLKIIEDHEIQGRNAPNYEDILGYLTAYVNPFELRNNDYRLNFATRNPEFKDTQRITALIDEIHALVCKYCDLPFVRGENNYLKPEELESKFQATYDALIGTYLYHEKKTIVFSTNYDPSIEIWCMKRNVGCFDGSERNSNIEVRRMLDEKRQINQIEKITAPNAIGLVRLHGSIWSHDINDNLRIKFSIPPDLRMFTDLYGSVPHGKPCIIFPGQEEKVNRGQTETLYNYFKDYLRGNCLFVGFSFRHDDFNRPILDRLLNGTIRKIGILSPHPDESAERLIMGNKKLKERIVTIKANFGEREAVDQLAQKWFNEVEGFSSCRSGYSLLETAAKWRQKMEGDYIKPTNTNEF